MNIYLFIRIKSSLHFVVKLEWKMHTCNGPVTGEGDFRLRQHRLSHPAFHRKRIVTLAFFITTEQQTDMKQTDTKPLTVRRLFANLRLILNV